VGRVNKNLPCKSPKPKITRGLAVRGPKVEGKVIGPGGKRVEVGLDEKKVGEVLSSTASTEGELSTYKFMWMNGEHHSEGGKKRAKGAYPVGKGLTGPTSERKGQATEAKALNNTREEKGKKERVGISGEGEYPRWVRSTSAHVLSQMKTKNKTEGERELGGERQKQLSVGARKKAY